MGQAADLVHQDDLAVRSVDPQDRVEFRQDQLGRAARTQPSEVRGVLGNLHPDVNGEVHGRLPSIDRDLRR